MLSIRHLYWSAGPTPILKGVDLEVKPGQAIGLVGPNGCGKSSLLNTINGFNKNQEGSILLDGKDISLLSVEDRARLGIGRVFQQFGICKSLTLFENLALAFVNKISWYRKFLPLSSLPKHYCECIDEVLRELDLYDKKDERAGNLSGWQMRLLEIARLYLQDTSVYLLDEPTAGVSPKLKGKVVALLQKIIAQWKTVLIVEHDFNFLASFVDTFCVMDDGKIIVSGDYNTVKASDKVRELYFGH